MIKSFADEETENIFYGFFSKMFPTSIQKRALRKLMMVDAANNINDLRSPPSNHLEKLSGKLEGYYSIRINKKYRIIFKWEQKDIFINVGIVDYH